MRAREPGGAREAEDFARDRARDDAAAADGVTRRGNRRQDRRRARARKNTGWFPFTHKKCATDLVCKV